MNDNKMNIICVASIISAMVICISAMFFGVVKATEVEEISSMQVEAEKELDELETEMKELIVKLDTVECNIIEKRIKAEELQFQYNDMKTLMDKQYEETKLRIQFMYENGNYGSLDVIMKSGSLQDLLNKSEYVTKVSEYDRQKLEEYIDTAKRVETLYGELEAELEGLEELQSELFAREEELSKLIEEKSSQVEDFNDKLNNALEAARIEREAEQRRVYEAASIAREEASIREEESIKASIEAASIEAVKEAKRASEAASIEASKEAARASIEAADKAASEATRKSAEATMEVTKASEPVTKPSEATTQQTTKAMESEAATEKTTEKVTEKTTEQVTEEATKEVTTTEATTETSAEATTEAVNEETTSIEQTQEETSAEPEQPKSIAQSVVELAYTFIGTPYRSGGSSPDGFDCSGFTSYLYGQYGISLSRTSSGQAVGGKAVASIEEALPGDIICYPGHVGLYVGNGKIIHATVPGDTVKLADVNYSSWQKMIGIRRYQ